MTDEAVVRTHSPIKTVWRWSAKLTRSIVLKDGTRLVRLADVRRCILKQPEHIQDRGSWHQAAELVILAAEHGGSIDAATTPVEDPCFWKRGTRVGGNDVRRRGLLKMAPAPNRPTSPRRRP